MKLKGVTKGLKQVERDLQKRSRGIDAVSKNALNRFGAIIRQDARKRIGSPVKPPRFKSIYLSDHKRFVQVVTKPSKPRAPGQSPKARMKDGYASIRNIKYETDMSTRNVRIGFVDIKAKYGNKTGAELQEFGGTYTAKFRLVPTPIALEHLKKTREVVKIREGGKLHRDIHTIWTQNKQEWYPVHDRRGQQMTFRNPKRPTMKPVFNKHKNRMTKIFIDYYRARFGK